MDFTKTGHQVVLMGISLCLGALSGFVFDVYRRIRNKLAPGPWLTAFGDIVYWAIITAVTFGILLRMSYGEVRGYMFLALAPGLFLYTAHISPHVIRVFVMTDLATHKCRRKLTLYIKRIGECKIFKIPGRIWHDARRIFSKIHKNP